MKFQLRPSVESDELEIHDVVVEAFGGQPGREVADLVADLSKDESAAPRLSLVAVAGGTIAGHILFTKARIENSQRKIAAAILAPLSVRPEFQGQGVGRQLISEGLSQLRATACDLVFVLGYPDYYQRHGFEPAGKKGLNAPYSIPPKNADAWMVQELHSGVVGKVSGRVICAEALDDPKHWQE